MKPVALVSVAFLSLITLAHLLRLFLGLDVAVGTLRIPPGWSAPAALFTGALTVLLARESRRG